jgi:hypothetical protein
MIRKSVKRFSEKKRDGDSTKSHRTSGGDPINNGVDECPGLLDRRGPGGTNANRNRPTLANGPFPSARKFHFGDGKSYASMHHEGPPPMTPTM